mmetsp:Transcript_26071/g.54395  ORF Transcript_26071/g.54395 Transcript_26071/m.54395 type:complete len:344 (-) Transcript_26071:37-1068(-)
MNNLTITGEESSYNGYSTTRIMRILTFSLMFVFKYEFATKQSPAIVDVAFKKHQTERMDVDKATEHKQQQTRPKPQILLNDSMEMLWDDLNLSSTLSCGCHKCFIPSISNSEVGYVISKAERGALDDMINETEKSQEMKRKYQAKHFFIAGEIPFAASMPQEIRTQIIKLTDENLLRHFPSGDNLGDNSIGAKLFFDHPSVIVQKLKTAEKSALLLHCSYGDAKLVADQLPRFLSNVAAKVEDTSEFLSNLAKDRYMMYEMLTGMPELRADFQVLVSTSGELFFLDFGGHGSWDKKNQWDFRGRGGKSKKELCGKHFDVITEAVEALSKKNYVASTSMSSFAG